MSEKFTINLDNRTFAFGSLANGSFQNLDTNLSFKEKNDAKGIYSTGSISGDFIGEIKNMPTIPVVVRHKIAQDSSRGFNIIVLGLGGTGGYLVRDLTRFIFALKEKGDSRSFNLFFVDPDKVEHKNILRQNFSPKDEGKYKAEVLAKRYGSAFGLEIETITEFADYNLLSEICSFEKCFNLPTLIIGCVDNNKARRSINDFVKRQDQCYWIDSGNEQKSGQVFVGFGKHRHYGGMNDNETFPLPTVVDIYPEISDEKQDEVENKVSCAERAVVDTQNIFVNMSAAGYILNFVRQILMKEELTLNGVEFNIKGITVPRYLTKEYLNKVYSK
jgi:PRTRC genetic system ThiF family protein